MLFNSTPQIMGTRKSSPGQEETKPETRRYLAAAVYFLDRGSFADCRSYAVRAKESDPTHPAPTKILSIASVLSVPNITPTLPDYYTIFNLPRFESDSAQIESSFKTLTSILDPNVNPYPNSSVAFEVVLKVWSVLSNPLEKARFDEELSRNLSGCPVENGGDTFWTMCPYCYYAYQYERVFEECCLRCTNGSCGRGFHAVAVSAPPAEVVEKGRYWCPGFVPLDFRKTNVDENGDILWLPFGSTSRGTNATDKCNAEGKEVEDNDFQHHGEAKKMRSGGVSSSSAFTSKCVDTDAEKLESGGRRFRENVSKEARRRRKSVDTDTEKLESGGHGFRENVLKETRRRRKSVAWSSKKLMGRGYRVDRNVAHSKNGFAEEWHLHMDGNEDLESGFGEATNKDVEGGVDFFEGDDDVLVGLSSDFDFGTEDDL